MIHAIHVTKIRSKDRLYLPRTKTGHGWYYGVKSMPIFESYLVVREVLSCLLSNVLYEASHPRGSPADGHEYHGVSISSERRFFNSWNIRSQGEASSVAAMLHLNEYHSQMSKSNLLGKSHRRGPALDPVSSPKSKFATMATAVARSTFFV